MAAKPIIVPIHAKYHIMRSWWDRDQQDILTCCGRVARIGVVRTYVSSYNDQRLCQRCVRLRPRPRRFLNARRRQRHVR